MVYQEEGERTEVCWRRAGGQVPVAEGTAAAVAPSRGGRPPVDALQRKLRMGRCRRFLFLVANRYAGSGGIKMPSNAGREVSELWAGARALAQYFAALEGGFRLSMRKPSKHVNCGVYDSNSRFRPSIPTSKRSLSNSISSSPLHF